MLLPTGDSAGGPKINYRREIEAARVNVRKVAGGDISFSALGPEGSYSHGVTLLLGGPDVDVKLSTSFEDVVADAAKQRGRVAVLPLFNKRSFGVFYDLDRGIRNEDVVRKMGGDAVLDVIHVPVVQHLIAAKKVEDTDLAGRRVFSRRDALDQGRGRLSNLGLEIQDEHHLPSTSNAAERLSNWKNDGLFREDDLVVAPAQVTRYYDGLYVVGGNPLVKPEDNYTLMALCDVPEGFRFDTP